ncbi:winged helix-turn-helix transcriptional regulator [Nonomuraea sp. NPDC048916]|uniref:winged helix-turn-helix transcriptional regulator n=1 Tax=Nonomuraea sp. NPDC048916 TaxID=3154232 RepID=UPI0033EE4A9F
MARELRAQDTQCSIAQAAAVIGDWWSLLIVREVTRGHHRFDDLLGELGISRKVLTERLKHLVEHGVLAREPYQTAPVRHEYVLTGAGWALAPMLITMQDWADRWLLGDGTLTGVATPQSAAAARLHALLGTQIPAPFLLPATLPLPATPSLAATLPLPATLPLHATPSLAATLPATSSAAEPRPPSPADARLTAPGPAASSAGSGPSPVPDGRPPRNVDVVADAAATVLFGFPATGVPSPLPPDWSQVPGAVGCTLENRLFRDREPEFAAHGIAIHGVSTQRPDEQAAFAAAEDIPFALLSDMDLRLAAALRLPTFRAGQALRLKRVILIADRARTVRHVIFPVLDIPEAVAESLEAARAIATAPAPGHPSGRDSMTSPPTTTRPDRPRR